MAQTATAQLETPGAGAKAPPAPERLTETRQPFDLTGEMAAEVGRFAMVHGNYPRAISGERVVVHITFSRLALRPVEDYTHLDEKWLEGKPYPLRVMLGREDFLGSTTIARGHADYAHLARTFNWAKT